MARAAFDEAVRRQSPVQTFFRTATTDVTIAGTVIPADMIPFLLGHEAAGIVESIGENVTDVGPGDFVILNWRAGCGQCRACLRGRPWYCFDTHDARQKMTLADGTELSPALGIGAFAEKTLVAAGRCTKGDPAAYRPPRACSAVA